jgi:hypothetical protein
VTALRTGAAWRARQAARCECAPSCERLPLWWGDQRIGSVEAEFVERLAAPELLLAGDGGWRGAGDAPMPLGPATQLLERIVADQRRIIEVVTGRPAAETPQVWALYKEVQDYYDAGMRVPDDVTLLFADDNWGNIRRLPQPGARRAGGYGVYYHFDYVGGPRNYKWINTNPIERVWQQMKLAWDHGADRLWIVNVGDIKPMEFPTSFFLDMAWDADGMTLARMESYARHWAEEQFGAAHAAQAGSLLTRYGQLIGRRKPELLDASTYDLGSGEWARVIGEWEALRSDAEELEKVMTPARRGAYFELVLHPILAAENLHRLYFAVARNHAHAEQGRASANRLADEAELLFRRDGEIRRRYEVDTAGGKWTQMMSQTHIGYTGWQQPPRDVMPEVRRIALPAEAAMSVADAPLAFSAAAWSTGEIRIYNRGSAPFEVRASASADWLRLGSAQLTVGAEASLPVWIDRARAPLGLHRAEVTLAASTGETARVGVSIDNNLPAAGSGFVERDGRIAIEAAHHDEAFAGTGRWLTIPNLGRTLSALTFVPAKLGAVERPGASSPHLEYRIWLKAGGPVELRVFASPGLDFRGLGLQRYAVSIDGGAPHIVNPLAGENERQWNRAVADAVRIGTTRFDIATGGAHRIRLWPVDPGLVFQRLVLQRGGADPTYLGPPESARR